VPTRQLPPKPNLAHLKHQAKDLLQQLELRDRSCAQRLREFHPRLRNATDEDIFSCELTLSDAQLAIAHEYGFASWPRLRNHVEKPGGPDDVSLPHHERIADTLFSRAVHLIDCGDASVLALLLKEQPHLIRQRVSFEGGNYFRNPALLEFIAENPVRHGTLPRNIVQIATVLLEAGPESSSVNDTLGLVASGRVARECGVQLALIEALCRYGADPNQALATALLHGEFQAVNQLVRSGAQPDLAVYAATGDDERFLLHLPASNSSQRALALSLAAQYGHTEIARKLLDRGTNPNQYGPGHSHSTPLHQAALAGHLDTVRLLIERGASLSMRDTIWNGTAADWAKHAGKTTVERFLREQQKHED
jgi:Ankyrin repeats (3 copies)